MNAAQIASKLKLIEAKISKQTERLGRLDEQIGALMSKRVDVENRIAELLDELRALAASVEPHQ